MKYAHLADVHIGSWRDPKLKDISTEAFCRAADRCIEEEVDFVLIAGDLFNTSLPQIDNLKRVTAKLKELKDKGISVYGIAGSHDFSSSGKTMLDVLENAGLFRNVCRGTVDEEGKLKLNFTIDKKTGAKITGMLGLKGMLDRKYYEALDTKNLENEEGYKIFLFHTALNELKPKEYEKMDSSPVSLLPKNFNYYGGGHIHIIERKNLDGRNIAFPGALFPANFSELEKYGKGGFYLIEDNKINWEPVEIYKHRHINIDCEGKTPKEAENAIDEEVKDKDFTGTIVTIRLRGKLKAGKPSDIDYKELYRKLYGKNAYFVMKNANFVTSEEFEEINVNEESSDDIEAKLIEEHAGQLKVFEREKEIELTKSLVRALANEKHEGERVIDFEKRLADEVDKIIGNI